MTEYALAHDLKGFRLTTVLRVIVTRRDAGMVWVRTADLMDAGTPLVLAASQVRPIPEAACPVRHRTGLVDIA